jgi:hypothetical protein
MVLQDLLDLVASLSREQQEVVVEFVRILKNAQAPVVNFGAALDEFVRSHPELLRRLSE